MLNVNRPLQKNVPQASALEQYNNETGKGAQRRADPDDWAGHGNFTRAVMRESCFCLDA